MGFLSSVLFQLGHHSPLHQSSPSDFHQLKNGSKKMKYLHYSNVGLTIKTFFILERKKKKKQKKKSTTHGKRVGSLLKQLFGGSDLLLLKWLCISL